MSVLLNLESEMKSEESGEIGAFTANDVCVGASSFQISNSKFQIGVAVWGDDPTTEVVDGLREGETFSLKIWNPQTSVEGGLVPASIDGRKRLVYRTDGFVEEVVEIAASIRSVSL